MREVVAMWRNAQMVAITVVIAALYMTALIPSSGLVIVPGFTTVRPATALPIVFSLIVGPAAAWGAAFGNLLSDAFSGQLTSGSVFGFVGNFFLGFAAYKLWGNLGPLSSGEEPDMRSPHQLLEYLVAAFVAAAGTAAIIAWGLDVLGLFAFSVFATVITVNDFVAAAFLGPPILYLVYPRVARAGFRYTDIMDRGHLPRRSRRHQRLAAFGIATVTVTWLVVGVAFDVVVEGVAFGEIPTGPNAATGGSLVQAVLGTVAFVALCGLAAMAGEHLSSLCEERSRWAERHDAGGEGLEL
ncbi:QueT transporter family protein [Halomarina rubra]|uniref:QueT transporter family protein n=1 Tax=Halomarina rubra TaxID=2071873 RepID=A0ABD6AS63_9EURY|nr:QueT transporter family protein [Halomarina rubra]